MTCTEQIELVDIPLKGEKKWLDATVDFDLTHEMGEFDVSNLQVFDIEEVGDDNPVEITLNADEMKTVKAYARAEVEKLVQQNPELYFTE